jgi:hypothetical protein
MSKRAALGGTGVFSPSAPKPEPKEAVEPAGGAGRNNRAGKTPMPFWTTVAAKKQLRVMAAVADTTQQEMMTEALNDFFRKHGKPPIA